MDRNRLINIFRFNKIFWAALGALFLANLGFYGVFVGGQKDKITQLQKLYKAKRAVARPNVTDRSRRFLKARQDIRSFREQLATRPEFAQVAGELFELLRRNGLSVDKMTYRPKETEVLDLVKYTTSFTVNGTYARLKAFLADIQNSRRLFCIETLSFSNHSSQEESVSVKIRVATYFR